MKIYKPENQMSIIFFKLEAIGRIDFIHNETSFAKDTNLTKTNGVSSVFCAKTWFLAQTILSVLG
uniref:Uncharacterized protein n=1 Tax=Romanomermis culicivorax TaxID=13658 RepID=A0A915I902_ROMCU